MSRRKMPEEVLEGRTRECGKILGRLMIRGERLNKLGDSWFSAKSILVECELYFFSGRVTYRMMGIYILLSSVKLQIGKKITSKQTVSDKICCQKGKSPDH
jgi:hypothetical protein